MDNTEVKLSLGIDRFINNAPIETLIFTDDTCPKCGEHSLKLVDTKMYRDITTNVGYVCTNCGYICPIVMDDIKIDKEVSIHPGYGKEISDFMNKFNNSESITGIGEISYVK